MEKKSVCKIPCLVIFTIFISLAAYPVFAEIKTFVKEYTYQASEEDSKNSSRTVSLREVKRLLLEELGAYLESITEVKNFRMTKDQIVTLTAGIVSTEVMEENWDGKTYWLKAKITADPDSVIKSIDKLRQDRQKVKELEETRKRSEALLKENERLKKELLTGKGGKKKEAAQAYQRNIKNLTAAEWFEKGLLSMTGNLSEAIKAFTKSIELDPQLAEAYVLRGFAYDELRDYEEAIRNYDKAIELSPQDAQTHYHRAGDYHLLGNYQKAIEDYDKAIALDPQNSRAYGARGLFYAELGNHSRAIKDFDKAIALNPKYKIAYGARARIYVELGKYQQAIRDFKIAARLGYAPAQDYLRKQGITW